MTLYLLRVNPATTSVTVTPMVKDAPEGAYDAQDGETQLVMNHRGLFDLHLQIGEAMRQATLSAKRS